MAGGRQPDTQPHETSRNGADRRARFELHCVRGHAQEYLPIADDADRDVRFSTVVPRHVGGINGGAGRSKLRWFAVEDYVADGKSGDGRVRRDLRRRHCSPGNDDRDPQRYHDTVGRNGNRYEGRDFMPVQYDWHRHVSRYVPHPRQLRGHDMPGPIERVGDDYAIVTSRFKYTSWMALSSWTPSFNGR